MYTEANIKTDVVVATPTTFALGAVTGGRVGFTVEEAEMLTELSFLGTVAPSTADTAIDFTFFVDGVDQADLVDGLISQVAGGAAGGGVFGVNLSMKKRFAKGSHVAEIRVRAAAGNVLVNGLLRPAKLAATRWSSNAVNAPQANSKQVAGVY